MGACDLCSGEPAETGTQFILSLRAEHCFKVYKPLQYQFQRNAFFILNLLRTKDIFVKPHALTAAVFNVVVTLTIILELCLNNKCTQ